MVHGLVSPADVARAHWRASRSQARSPGSVQLASRRCHLTPVGLTMPVVKCRGESSLRQARGCGMRHDACRWLSAQWSNGAVTNDSSGGAEKRGIDACTDNGLVPHQVGHHGPVYDHQRHLQSRLQTHARIHTISAVVASHRRL